MLSDLAYLLFVLTALVSIIEILLLYIMYYAGSSHKAAPGLDMFTFFSFLVTLSAATSTFCSCIHRELPTSGNVIDNPLTHINLPAIFHPTAEQN